MLWCIVLFGHRAIVERDTASWQETTFGTTYDCERRGRGNGNWCDYSFKVGDDWYRGESETYPEVTFGQTVDVYYDSRNPRANALQDYSKQSRKDERFAYILLSVLAAVVAFALWDRAPQHANPNQQSPKKGVFR
jgi:hypothetical protein